MVNLISIKNEKQHKETVTITKGQHELTHPIFVAGRYIGNKRYFEETKQEKSYTSMVPRYM